jgi:hypothetical protein
MSYCLNKTINLIFPSASASAECRVPSAECRVPNAGRQRHPKYIFAERRSGHRKSRKVELKLTCKDGSEHRYFATTSMPIDPGGAGISGGVYGVARDVTEKKQAQEVINYHAYHDTLTKLPNRVLKEDRLSLAMTQALRNNQRPSCSLIWTGSNGLTILLDTLWEIDCCNLSHTGWRAAFERVTR